MADVLIVCVREDEPQAKALADMFEAAGFSIGGAPSNDSALRSSGAGVVVWSQASIRSRPFLDAAQRVINAGKAVVASLIEPPPASSIGASPAFDLSAWDGDPNDAALDPLFFAVDRMVNEARAAVGGAAQAPEPPPPAYEPPPQRAAPLPRTPQRAAPIAPTYRPGPSGAELGSEAEHWRAIRESRDPADFMDYLSRFGPDGAFADVAELRLKQLTAAVESRAAARPSAPAPQRPAVRPTRPAPDPAPPRRAEPTPRRAEIMPHSRGYDRDLDRPPPAPAPRGEGGGLRLFVLLGFAAALGAGLYFGGVLDFASAPAPAAEEEAAEASAPAPETDAYQEAANIEPSAEDSTSVSDLQPPRARPQRPAETSARREPAPAPAARAPEPEPPTPAPMTSWQAGSARGPASLNPGAGGAPGSAIVPLSPPAQAPTQEAAATPAPPAALPAGTVSWAQRPSANRIASFYPARALRDNIEGRVVLDCQVLSDFSAVCSVASEAPLGRGFGRAAQSVASSYRANPRLSNGASAVGAQTRVVISFRTAP